MLPSESQATSVGWRNWPSSARQRRLRTLQRSGVLVGRFLLAAEHHDDAALGIELDHHVRALVDDPDVVLLVDAHGVGERPGVQVLADLADELACRVELQQLRRGRGVGGPAGVAARNTKMWPFELTATPDASPKYMSGGSFSGLGTESKVMLGTACCAKADGAINSISPVSQCLISSSRDLLLLLLARMLVDALRPLHASRVMTARPQTIALARA